MLFLFYCFRSNIISRRTQVTRKMLPRNLLFLKSRDLLKVNWYWFLWISKMWLFCLVLILLTIPFNVFLWFIKPRNLLSITFYRLIFARFISGLMNLSMWTSIMLTFFLLNINKLIPNVWLVETWFSELAPWIFWLI